MATNLSVADANAVLEDEDMQRELAELEIEESSEPEHIREARRLQFMKEMDKLKACRDLGCGDLKEITGDEEFLKSTTTIPQVVCHFYHNDFKRCAIMNKHLTVLAKKHFLCKFVKMNAEMAPFIVTRLKIRVLPTVLCFVDGKVVDRIVGFEELGGIDDFKTTALEKRLEKCGVIARASEGENKDALCGYTTRDNSDSDDD
eukprot:m.25052 g.25052  ORF g.25052 m.25052 type:complete len:202 (-) comp8819_c0_seq1:21-626(-)